LLEFKDLPFRIMCSPAICGFEKNILRCTMFR
jgi:hypothetical protein